MNESRLTREHRNVLQALHENPGSHLREIHDALVEMDSSGFVFSPDFGDGWNDERWAVRELRDDLSSLGLVTNDYQSWSLTEHGEERIP